MVPACSVRLSRLLASAPRSCCRSSAGHAQAGGPFAGFDGTWSGAGTVALSNGTTEHIRCKADYKVNATGLGLKQNLHCASDSYKFDLSSDVTSQGDRISGNWSEKSRNIFGNLQGTAGGGQIDVFVEASGFAANLNAADQRHQAGRPDQLQGRNPRRQHHDDEELIDRIA